MQNDRKSGRVSSGIDSVSAIAATMARVEGEAMTSQPEVIPSTEAALIGVVIDGRYVVERQLGEGGMGVVYAARHRMIDKRVAIKVLKRDMARDAEVTERFLQEARAASSIGNPHIVDISDFGTLPDGATFFVMEFLDGRSLTDVLASDAPLTVPRVVRVAKQVAEGLSAAHSAGIIHRDMKPDNVMLVSHGNEKDFAKILDFGIAKVGGEASRLTKAGTVFGTPHYMSPEQAAGLPVDLRADIYALGVIMYEMASGKVPFDADNVMGILTQHMYKAPPPMRALVPTVDIPAGLDAVVLKCLTKKAEGRYRTMAELVEDLEKLERGVVPEAVADLMQRSGGFNVPADYFRTSGMPAPVPATPRNLPSKRGWPLIAGIAGIATAVAIVGAILAKSSSTGAKPSASADPSATLGTSSLVASAATSAAVAPSASASALPQKKIVSVAIAVVPTDAKISHDGTDLGKSPIMLDVPEGEKPSIVVARDGYKSKTVVVDGSTRSVQVSLDKERGGGRPPPISTGKATPPTPTQPTKPSGGGEITDPWAH